MKEYVTVIVLGLYLYKWTVLCNSYRLMNSNHDISNTFYHEIHINLPLLLHNIPHRHRE